MKGYERDDSHIQRILQQAAANEDYAARLKCDRERESSRPFYLLRPRVFKDGNAWCVLLGDNIQEGVCGFGDTPQAASKEFDCVWLNGRGA